MVLVGINVCRRKVPSIARGVLKWRQDIPTPFDTTSNSALNPDLLRGISHTDRRDRFPFGLASFLTCCLAFREETLARPWPSDLALMLLQASHSFIGGVKHPGRALEWLRWLQANSRSTPFFPFAKDFRGFRMRTLFPELLRMSAGLRSFGMSPRTQSVGFQKPHGWARLHDLLLWLQDRTGLAGRFDPLFKEPLLVASVQRTISNGNPSAYADMLATKPFTYSIRGLGARGLAWDSLKARKPDVLPAATT